MYNTIVCNLVFNGRVTYFRKIIFILVQSLFDIYNIMLNIIVSHSN